MIREFADSIEVPKSFAFSSIPESFVVYKSIIVSIVLVAATALCLGAQEPSRLEAIPRSESSDEFTKSIRPLLVKYCADCHAPKSMEGLDFLDAQSESDLAKLRGVYAAVVEQLENRVMPPAGDLQPSQSERTTMTDWIRKTLDLKKSDTDRIAQYVVAAYEDKKGNLWFGTTANGADLSDFSHSFCRFFNMDFTLKNRSILLNFGECYLHLFEYVARLSSAWR